MTDKSWPWIEIIDDVHSGSFRSPNSYAHTIRPKHTPKTYAHTIRPKHMPIPYAQNILPKHIPKPYAQNTRPHHTPKPYAQTICPKDTSKSYVQSDTPKARCPRNWPITVNWNLNSNMWENLHSPRESNLDSLQDRLLSRNQNQNPGSHNAPDP